MPTDTERYNQTLDHILSLFVKEGQHLKALVQTWALKKNKMLIGKRLSLGGLMHSAAEKERRKKVRVLLLLYIVSENADPEVDKAEIIKFRKKIEKSSPYILTQQAGELISIIKNQACSDEKDFLVMMDSFTHASPVLSDRIKTAYGEIRLLLEKAKMNALEHQKGEKSQRFEKWFGKCNEDQITQVHKNLSLMYTAYFTQKLHLYYRGSEVKDMISDFSFSESMNGKMKPINSIASCFFPSNLQDVVDKDYPHIGIGEQFMGNTSLDGRPNGVTCAGALIHELSHKVCGTEDIPLKLKPVQEEAEEEDDIFFEDEGRQREKSSWVTEDDEIVYEEDEKEKLKEKLVPVYGYSYASYTALYYPAQAIRNADNYRCYCDAVRVRWDVGERKFKYRKHWKSKN